MPVKIRLARWGQRHRPFYRIIAADSRAPRDGKFLEVLGAYAPISHSKRETSRHIKRVWLNIPRLKHWLSTGAIPTDTVARLLGSAGLLAISPRSTAATSTTQQKGIAAAQRRGLVTMSNSSHHANQIIHNSNHQGLAIVLAGCRNHYTNGIFTRRLI